MLNWEISNQVRREPFFCYCDVGIMHCVFVCIYFFFCIEDLSAIWAHVLSSTGFRGASALDYLVHLVGYLNDKEGKKVHKLMCAVKLLRTYSLYPIDLGFS